MEREREREKETERIEGEKEIERQVCALTPTTVRTGSILDSVGII